MAGAESSPQPPSRSPALSIQLHLQSRALRRTADAATAPARPRRETSTSEPLRCSALVTARAGVDSDVKLWAPTAETADDCARSRAVRRRSLPCNQQGLCFSVCLRTQASTATSSYGRRQQRPQTTAPAAAQCGGAHCPAISRVYGLVCVCERRHRQRRQVMGADSRDRKGPRQQPRRGAADARQQRPPRRNPLNAPGGRQFSKP